MTSCFTAMPVFSARSGRASATRATLSPIEASGAQRQSFNTATITTPIAATASSTPSHQNGRLPRSKPWFSGTKSPSSAAAHTMANP